MSVRTLMIVGTYLPVPDQIIVADSDDADYYTTQKVAIWTDDLKKFGLEYVYDMDGGYIGSGTVYKNIDDGFHVSFDADEVGDHLQLMRHNFEALIKEYPNLNFFEQEDIKFSVQTIYR